MKEELLHFIWRYRLYAFSELKLQDGRSIQVIKPGAYNQDAGPDFFQAQIRIEELIWIGNVEIHIRASDWYKHRHQLDKAYDNVILHVVYESDIPILDSTGREIPVLELKALLRPQLMDRSQELMQTTQPIPCGKRFLLDDFVIDHWLERMTCERLEQKSELFAQLVTQNKGNWEESFYQHLAVCMGSSINALPFSLLAVSLPNTLLAKYKHDKIKLSALLFGQAGLVHPLLHPDLFREYAFLARKHSLVALKKEIWKYGRMRPQQFPDRRLAQWVELIHRSEHLFSKIKETEEAKSLSALFRQEAFFSPFHQRELSGISEESASLLLINGVVVALFAYGKAFQEEAMCERAFQLLNELKAEQNKVLRRYTDLGFQPKNALQTQGLLQLNRFYCEQKRCLHCGIGWKVLSLEHDGTAHSHFF